MHTKSSNNTRLLQYYTLKCRALCGEISRKGCSLWPPKILCIAKGCALYNSKFCAVVAKCCDPYLAICCTLCVAECSFQLIFVRFRGNVIPRISMKSLTSWNVVPSFFIKKLVPLPPNKQRQKCAMEWGGNLCKRDDIIIWDSIQVKQFFIGKACILC